MSFSNGPTVVTNGLVLSLDAGDRNSYVSGSTTWFDLAGTNNGTLTNGPTFNTGNGGNIVFDGVNDYVNCGTVTFPGNTFTIELIFEWNNLGSTSIGFLISGVYEQVEIHTGGDSGTNGLRFIPYTFRGSNQAGSIDAANMITSGINVVTFTAEYSSPSKAYKNGNFFTSSLSTSTDPLNSNQTISLSRRADNGYFFSGKIYSAKLYNRALSASEVLQNYNALKGRFGL